MASTWRDTSLTRAAREDDEISSVAERSVANSGLNESFDRYSATPARRSLSSLNVLDQAGRYERRSLSNLHVLDQSGRNDGSRRSLSSLNVHEGADRHNVMAKFLYHKASQAQWFQASECETPGAPNFDVGVLLRRPDGNYTTEPRLMDECLVGAATRLELPVVLTMASEVVHALIQQLSPLQKSIEVEAAGLTVPIVNSVEELGQGNCPVGKGSYLCLCRQDGYALIWSDSAQSLLSHATQIETLLVGLVWGAPMSPPVQPMPAFVKDMNRRHTPPLLLPRNAHGRRSFSPDLGSHAEQPFYIPSGSESSDMIDTEKSEKLFVIETAIAKEELGDRAFDPEKEGYELPPRPFLITHAVIIGLSIALVVIVEMACISNLLRETMLDGKYLRWSLIVTVPVFSFFSLFFFIVIIGSIFQLFGPLSGINGNSTYYSAKAPKPDRHPNMEYPHITIQMPVYKEGLKGVIIPSVTSVLAAIKYYERQGGTASIYVNEDGMQTVKPELAEARKAFYELNNIGWCARPAQCTEQGENYFLRKGQFKKASNMNYCLDFSLRVEDEMLRLFDLRCQEKGCTREDLTIEEEEALYVQARDQIIENDGGKTQAGGDVRIGELILIIDSDTRVPEDCLLYGALEMHESPEVALLQHSSGILQVVNNVFENGITYFTNLIYNSIDFAVGNGDCAPFVGHNTFARWKALQSIAFHEDDTTKFWSDSHVSEDFDVSLRLQIAGFIVRLATYHKGGFKEGVSLTVYDELARWEKYAYGCNELVFNPLIKWPTKGPITRLFLRFLWSNIKITSKITIIAYIGTYYAIASALPLSLANYLIVGWLADDVDQFYIDSWKIFVGMAVVFNIFSPLAYAMLRHRLGQKTFFWSILETVKWTPMFLLFFGGISFHLCKALFCHFFSIKMEWTATAKELEASGFRVGLDRVFRDFKWMYLFVVFPISGGMIYLALYAPWGWTISDFAAIVPLANQIGCHALVPFALGLF